MSWEDVIKFKNTEEFIERVMADGKERTSRDIIVDVYELIDKIKQDETRRYPAYSNVPTDNKVKVYMSKHSKYEKRLVKTLGTTTTYYKLR